MSSREVGLLVYSQGFAVSRDEYIFRELAFCDWTGHHHVLFKYTLPPGLTYATLSEDAKTRVDGQTKTVDGLPFEPFLSHHNRHEFHPYHQLRDDVTRWCHTISHPRTMAGGCLHCQWSLSIVPRSMVFPPYSRPGRPGMQGVIQSSHRQGQCDGHQRSWSKLVQRSPPRGTRYLARLLRSSTCLSDEWLVASTLQRVTDPIPS